MLPAEVATPLVMVLNELLLNAVEHGFARGSDGEVVISAHRFRRQLHVSVADNGRGLPEDFDLDGADRLGLQIIRTLARGELRGSIEMRNRAEGERKLFWKCRSPSDEVLGPLLHGARGARGDPALRGHARGRDRALMAPMQRSRSSCRARWSTAACAVRPRRWSRTSRWARPSASSSNSRPGRFFLF